MREWSVVNGYGVVRWGGVISEVPACRRHRAAREFAAWEGGGLGGRQVVREGRDIAETFCAPTDARKAAQAKTAAEAAEL